MSSDEQAIRNAVAAWMNASADGDLPRVLELIDDDVVFLGPGRPPMRKDQFAAASKGMEGKVRVEGASDIQDLQANVDAGSCSSRIVVNVPKAHSLGVEAELFAKPSEKWDFGVSGT